MTPAYEAIVPVFLVIAMGFIAKRLALVPESAWAAVNSFGYKLLYPAFLFSTIAAADFSGPDTSRFLICLLLGFGLAGLWGLSLRFWLKDDGPAFTSVFQGSVRWNGFIVLASAPALYGAQGLALVALAYGPIVTLVNVMSVFVLAKWGDNDVVPSLRGALKEAIRNPLVLASVIGIAANLIGFSKIIGPLAPALNLVGHAAMPIALISVGAALRFDGLKNRPQPLALGTASKLLIAPLIMLGVTSVMGLSPLASAVAIGVATMPSAPASYVLARELGGDAPLMAGLVTLTTLLALITIPLWHTLTLGLV